MRTLIQLAFTLIIAFTMISCGGDAKSSNTNTESSKAKDNSNRPAPEFKMVKDKGYSKRERPLDKSNSNKKTPVVNNNQDSGGAFSDQNGNNPINPSVPLITDSEILRGVPDACSLISTKDIASIFGISEAAIEQKDASHTKSPYTKSCFYRWEGASPNTGILVQVQANPVEEEYAEWVSLFVSSKRTTGEKTMGTNETFKYEKMEGLGDDGSYSHRLGKYVWRDGNKYAFMIAFNTNSAKELQMKNAKAIGNIMMDNYKK